MSKFKIEFELIEELRINNPRDFFLFLYCRVMTADDWLTSVSPLTLDTICRTDFVLQYLMRKSWIISKEQIMLNGTSWAVVRWAVTCIFNGTVIIKNYFLYTFHVMMGWHWHINNSMFYFGSLTRFFVFISDEFLFFLYLRMFSQNRKF